MALTTRLRASINAQQTAPLDGRTASDPIARAWAVSLADGAGAGQANRVFSDASRTLAASATEDLDLAAGALTDAFGTVLTFARVKGLIVAAAAGNTNNVVIGGAATNAWLGPFSAATHTMAIRPGAVLPLFCGAEDATGYAVVAGTGDQLRIANGGAGTPVTYEIHIVGTAT